MDDQDISLIVGIDETETNNQQLPNTDNQQLPNTGNQQLPNTDNQQLPESPSIIDLTLDYMLSLKIYLETEFNLEESTDLYIIRHLFNFLKDMSVPTDRIKTAINLLYENIDPTKLDEINHMINRLTTSNRMFDLLSIMTTNIINNSIIPPIPNTTIDPEEEIETETETDEMPSLEMQIDNYTGDFINPANIVNMFTNNLNNLPILMYPTPYNMYFNNLIYNNFVVISDNQSSIIRHQNGKETLSKSTLDIISPTVIYEDLGSDVKSKFSTCSICLDDFKEENIVRQIKCSHLFHQNCIDPWLINESYKCPVCRAETIDNINPPDT